MMAVSGFSAQTFDFAGSSFDLTYFLDAACYASATNPTRPDGLFAYLEELEGVPGGGAELEDVDVVEYCVDAHDTEGLPGDGDGGGGGGYETRSTDTEAADSTGGSDSSDGTGSDSGSPPPAPEVPDACGPFAEQRYWVRPSNNYATWSSSGSSGSASDGSTTYPMVVSGGGLEYTVLPCDQGRCVRLDRLSVHLEQVGGGQEVTIAMVEPSELIPLAVDDTFDIPAESMRFAARYTYDDHRYTVEATNDIDVGGTIDGVAGTILLRRFDASSSTGNLSSRLTLSGDLDNTQPDTEIVVNQLAWNRVNLRAIAVDAESDPVDHTWRIFGVGVYTGDAIEVTLAPGTYAVALVAEDVHRARSVDATWVTITKPGS